MDVPVSLTPANELRETVRDASALARFDASGGRVVSAFVRAVKP